MITVITLCSHRSKQTIHSFTHPFSLSFKTKQKKKSHFLCLSYFGRYSIATCVCSEKNICKKHCHEKKSPLLISVYQFFCLVTTTRKIFFLSAITTVVFTDGSTIWQFSPFHHNNTLTSHCKAHCSQEFPWKGTNNRTKS